MCGGTGSNGGEDYFYITEGKIILQTWCKGLKHVPSQGSWQVTLFIPETPHSLTMFESPRRECIGCSWPEKISLHSHGVPWPSSRFESSPTVEKNTILESEKEFWITSLLLVKTSILGKFLNLSGPWFTFLCSGDKLAHSFKIGLRSKWKHTHACFCHFKTN